MNAEATESVPPGTPYHQLARTRNFRWWRPLLATAIAFPAVFAVGRGILVLAESVIKPQIFLLPYGNSIVVTDKSIDFNGEPLKTFAIELAVALALPVFLLAGRLMWRRQQGGVISVAGRVRWRWLLVCFGVAAAADLLYIAADILASDWRAIASPTAWGNALGSPTSWQGWPFFVLVALISVVTTPLQAGAEEYVVRGWLQQVVGCYLRSPWPGIILTSVIFAVVHLNFEPSALMSLFAFSVAMGWLVVRTGGLECAVALHITTNVGLSVLNQSLQIDPFVLDGGSRWYPAFVVLIVALYSVVIVRLADRLGIDRYSPKPDIKGIARASRLAAGVDK